jgi:6-phosphogluconolactonase
VTPDNQFLCAVDSGIDQVVLYTINSRTSKLQQIDTLRMGREAGPKSIHFSRDGKYAYVLCEITNVVRVYSYHVENKYPVFELLEEQSTLSDERDPHDAAVALRVSYDGNYVFCSTAGDNSVAMFKVDHKTGHLERQFSLPTAGDYPKDIALFPDQQHIAVVNNGSNTITTFRVDYAKKVLVMKGRPQELDKPNCIIFHQVQKGPDVFKAVPEDEAEKKAVLTEKVITPVPID